jgi:hypothetical protein
MVGFSTAKVRAGRDQRDQRDQRAARLDGDRPGQCGEGCEHRVEDWLQLRAGGVLVVDEFFGVGDEEVGVAEGFHTSSAWP